MVRIFDPENQADFPHKVVFDFDRGEDDLNGEDVQRRFLHSVNQGRNLCSGSVIGDGQIPYTIHDPNHPLLLVEVVAHNDAQVDIGTQLIIERQTCYIHGLIAGGTWRMAKNEDGTPKYQIKGAKSVSFGVSYQEVGGIEKVCKVGEGPLLKALYTLRNQQEQQWCFHYATLCVNIAEPLRFHGIAATVSRGLAGYRRYNTITLTTNEQELIKNWKAMSQRYQKNGWTDHLKSKTGIARVEDLPSHAALLLRI